MATNTNNYGFKKPEENDFYSIEDQNRNWDLADTKMAQLNSDLDNCLKVAQGESGGVILQPDATSAVYVGFTTSVLEGYQILGCIGYALNQTDLLIANIMTSGNQMRFDVKNIGSTTKTVVVVAKILLMKSS